MSTSKQPDVFPDSHHKMSKKIAQLTKVIFHLNTKNEDHQIEVESLVASHQAEIENMLRDSAMKIDKYKELLGTKQALVNIEAQMVKLTKKHDAEKQAAIRDFEEYKAKAKVRDDKIVSDCHKKIEIFKDEMSQVNVKFHDKTTAFENTIKELKKALELDRDSAAARILDLKSRNDSESAEAIRKYNEKYQAMLIEQLTIQENLKADFDKQMKAEKAAAAEKFQTELHVEILKKTAEMNGDRQEALMAQKREYDSKLQSQREEMMGKIEKLIADANIRNIEIEELKNEKTLSMQVLNQRVAELQAELAAQRGGSEEASKNLADLLHRTRGEVEDSQSKLALTETALAEARDLITKKESTIAELDKNLKLSDSDIRRLQIELDRAQNDAATSDSSLRLSVASYEGQVKGLRDEINGLGLLLSNTREELKASQKTAQKEAEAAASKISGLETEIARLKTDLGEASKVASSVNMKAGEELEAMKKAMVALQEQHLLDRKTEIDALKAQHQSALEAKNKEIEDLAQAGRSDLTQSLQLFEESKAAAAKAMQELQQAHARTLEEHEETATRKVAALQHTIQRLEADLKTATDTAAGDIGLLHSEKTKADELAKLLRTELDTARASLDASRAAETALKLRLHSAEEDVLAALKKAAADLETQKAKLINEWSSKLSSQLTQGSLARDEALKTAAMQHEAEMAELKRFHNEEVTMLKNALQKEANDSSSELARLEREKLQLEAALASERDAGSSKLTELLGRHAEEMETLAAAHKKELETMRKGAAEALAKREVALKDDQTKVKAAYEADAVSSRQKMEELMRKALEDAAMASESAMQSALSSLKEKLSAEYNDSIESVKKVHASTLELANTLHAKALRDSQAELEVSRAMIKQMETYRAEVEAQLSDERDERQRREQKFLLDKDELSRIHNAEMDEVLQSTARAQSDQAAKLNAQIRNLESQFSGERSQLESKISALRLDFGALESRWKSRESRPEDLERIQSLESEVAEKEELLKNIREEINYFKREMLNREENYNSKFSRNPNVGIMNVLKQKDMSSGSGSASALPNSGGSSGKPPPIPSNKPSYTLPAPPKGGPHGMGAVGGVIGGISSSGSVGGLTNKDKKSTSSRS